MKNNFYAIYGKFHNAGVMPHFHETFSIGFFTKGGCRYKVGKKDEIIKTGEIRIIPPYELHKTYEGSWEYLHFDVDYEFLLNIIKDIKQDDIKDLKLNSRLKNDFLTKSAFRLYKYLNEDDLIIEECFFDLAKGIYINFDKECKIDYQKSRLSKAIEYIYQNYNDTDLSVEKIAKKLNLSPYYFVRSFNSRFGITPHRFIISLRVEKAKQMILKSDFSLALIARICGFSDQSHMIKIFKKIVGYKPGILKN